MKNPEGCRQTSANSLGWYSFVVTDKVQHLIPPFRFLTMLFTTEITKITEKKRLKISVVNALFSYKLGLKNRSLRQYLRQIS